MTVNRQKLGRAARIAYLTVSTAVIILALVLAAAYIGGLRMFAVKSGSMGDELPVGSLCFVSSYSSFEGITAGDVIAFRASDDMFAAHRAVSVTEAGIITRGDENEDTDRDPVTKDNYLGKTLFAIPRLGRLLEQMRTVPGMIVTVIFLILLIAGGFFFGKKRSE